MPEKTVILLFPDPALAQSIIRHLPPDYRASIVVLSAEQMDDFRRRKGLNVDIDVFPTGSPPDRKKHSGLLRESNGDVACVIYFMGRDWFGMNIEEKGVRWKIDLSREENMKLSAVEAVLHGLDKNTSILWINLAQGRHQAAQDGYAFCNTRYGMTGFQKTVELSSQLGNVRMINICLNYFGKSGGATHAAHCRHCVSEELLGQDMGEIENGVLVKAVIESIDDR